MASNDLISVAMQAFVNEYGSGWRIRAHRWSDGIHVYNLDNGIVYVYGVVNGYMVLIDIPMFIENQCALCNYMSQERLR